MKPVSRFLLSLCGVLLMQTSGIALQSAIRFSADGFFPEFADPASMPAQAYPSNVPLGVDDVGMLSQTSVGWTFDLTEPAELGGLGVYDYGADGLLADHMVGLWKIDDHDNAGLTNAELVAAALVPRGAGTPFDGQWRYSTDLYADTFNHFFTNNYRNDRYVRLWDPIVGGIDLTPGTYAIISNQIASDTNRDATAFETSRQIDFDWFVGPTPRFPLHDPRLDITNTLPIGPGVHYDIQAIDNQPYEFFPTNVQLIRNMVVGPTLFLVVPEPSSLALVVIAAAVTCRRARLA